MPRNKSSISRKSKGASAKDIRLREQLIQHGKNCHQNIQKGKATFSALIKMCLINKIDFQNLLWLRLTNTSFRSIKIINITG